MATKKTTTRTEGDGPGSDEEIIAHVAELGRRDGKDSEDEVDGLDEAEIRDIADDAWFNSGWMDLENDPRFEEVDLDELSERLNLSRVYKDAFVQAIRG